MFTLFLILSLSIFVSASENSTQAGVDWTKVGPPHASGLNCNQVCASKGLGCSEDKCPSFVGNNQGSIFSGGEKLQYGANSFVHYSCSNTWGNISDSYENSCCCTGNVVSVENATEQNKCSDSDGGKLFYSKGSTTQLISMNGVEKTFTGFDDQCISAFILREGYCEGNKIVTADFNCPYGCNEGICSKSNNKCDDGTVPQCELNGNDYTCSTCPSKSVCSPGSGGFCEDGTPAPCSLVNGACVCSTCPSKKVDMEGCLNMPESYWDQETDSCKSGFSDKLVKDSCSDPDDGMNIFKSTHTYGFRSSYANEKDKRIRTGGSDACANDKQVVENYCDQNGYIQTTNIDCPNGCMNGACVQVEISPTPTTGPVEVPKPTYTQEVIGNSFVCNGCAEDNKCYPFGYRKVGDYCSDNSQFVTQLEAEKSCDNNFECSSNVCVNSTCISPGLIEKILNWFKKFFG